MFSSRLKCECDGKDLLISENTYLICSYWMEIEELKIENAVVSREPEDFRILSNDRQRKV